MLITCGDLDVQHLWRLNALLKARDGHCVHGCMLAQFINVDQSHLCSLNHVHPRRDGPAEVDSDRRSLPVSCARVGPAHLEWRLN
jgi:hypothetical protein